MHKFLDIPRESQIAAILETAARMNISPIAVEKDFWICYVLACLFHDEEMASILCFKGGTSLSKCFDIIYRFSEDIDLVLNWSALSPEDPYAQRSKTKQGQFNEQMLVSARAQMITELAPKIQGLLGERCMVRVDDEGPLNVHVKYDSYFDSETYLRKEILLEIGPLASRSPSQNAVIRPYLNQILPPAYQAETSVHVIVPERTFWEKITILHAQAHRAEDSMIPLRYSRHYYDIYHLSQSDFKKSALADLSLLEEVVCFKQRFYPSAWSRYDLAAPGSLRLIPKQVHLYQLRVDYDAMEEMLFGDVPSWEAIVNEMAELERVINDL